VHPVRLEREHLSLSVAAMPDVSEGDLLGMLAFLCFYNRHNQGDPHVADQATRRRARFLASQPKRNEPRQLFTLTGRILR